MIKAKKKRILVIDDEQNIRNMIRYLLEGLGHEVEEAQDGQHAFRQATMGDFDLLLLDIMMPGWNGVEAVKSLDFIEKSPKVIVVSGFVTEELKEELSQLTNIHGYLSKPFKIEALRDLVTEVLAEN